MKKTKINFPTKLTIARIILAIILVLLIFVFYLLDEFNVFDISSLNIRIGNATVNKLMLVILSIFLLASITDFFDGYIARKYNLITDLGKFLDPLADKMLINSLMIFLSFNFISLHNSLKFPFFLVILMIIRDLVVDGIRLVAARKNVVIAASFLGKAKTVLEMISIVLVLLNGFPFSLFDYGFNEYLHITDFFCYLTTLASLISGIKYFNDYKYLLFEENK